MAKKKPYRFFVYLLARAGAGLVSCLPRVFLGGVVRILSPVLFRVIKKQRELTVKHLKIAFSDKSDHEICDIAKEVITNLGLTAVDSLKLSRLDWNKVSGFVDPGNAFEIYNDLLKKGCGIISMTAHLGNWDLLAGTFGMKGYQGAVLARRIYYEPYNRWIVGIRQHMNVRTIYRDQASREILELLSRNEIIGLLPDQDIDSIKGIFVPFFGREAYTPIAPARLAISSGAPIVCNFLVRQPNNRYKIEVGDIIEPRRDVPRDAEVERITKAWMKSFENIIKRYPGQWAWMHDRWKTRPNDVRKVFSQERERVEK